MKFGLFYGIQIPEPHYPGIEQERYKQVLSQAELADELGYDYFWSAEHHFLRELSHCSAPEVLYGAISQRTKRIRIGHAVALLPYLYNHPIRVAERVAVLDILSDGRMDLGTGRSTTPIEMGGFGINPEETDSQWLEALQIIPRMWTEDPFSCEGQYFNIPPRSVIPKPVQKPHPPLWMACSRESSFKRAGEMGMGVLSFSIGGFEQQSSRVQQYREAIKHANPVGSFINDQVAAMCLVHCGEDDREAKEVGKPQAEWFISMAQKIYEPWREPAAVVPETYRHTIGESARDRVDKTVEDHMEAGAFALGDPDACIKAMEAYQAAGVDQVLCVMQIGNIPHTRVMDSLKLFAKYVIPHFR